MTDPTATSSHPVEDRVRRTLAARADDMVPGDAAGALPDFVHDARTAPRRLSGRRRPLLAAAAVVVVAATAGLALATRDGDGRGDGVSTVSELPSDGADTSPITAPRAVVEALRNERGLAAVTLMGLEEAIALPVTDTARARGESDAAIAAFGAFVATSPDGAAYQSGLAGLGALTELRGDVDADTSPRNVGNSATAQDVFGRYSAIVDELLTEQQAYADTIDDPAVRTAVMTHAQGLRLREQTTQLAQAVLLVVLVPDSDTVTDIARRRADVQLGLEALLAVTAGTPYEAAAVTVVGEVRESGLLEVADSAIDVSVTLGAVDRLEGESWPAFLDAVEEMLRAEG